MVMMGVLVVRVVFSVIVVIVVVWVAHRAGILPDIDLAIVAERTQHGAADGRRCGCRQGMQRSGPRANPANAPEQSHAKPVRFKAGLRFIS